MSKMSASFIVINPWTGSLTIFLTVLSIQLLMLTKVRNVHNSLSTKPQNDPQKTIFVLSLLANHQSIGQKQKELLTKADLPTLLSAPIK